MSVPTLDTLLSGSPVALAALTVPALREAVPADAPVVAPRPAPERAYRRHRGGTFSSTVETVWFADGGSARTDLIRLNPNIDTYSLDLAGIAPRGIAHYAVDAWTSVRTVADPAVAHEVQRVLLNSFPIRSLGFLSEQLRAAGYPLGVADLREHEAIAATQAAIWFHTNGVALDTRRLDEPVRAHWRRDGHSVARALPISGGGVAWHGDLAAGESLFLEFEFEGTPQLSGYGVDFGEGTDAVAVRLERSSDRRSWRTVHGSELSVASAAGRPLHAAPHARRLGLGATAGHSAGGRTHGFAHYRVVIQAPGAGARVVVNDVDFTLVGTRRFRNNSRVVYLYDHLLRSWDAPAQPARAPELHGPRTWVTGSQLVGPFWLDTEGAAEASVHGPTDARVLDAQRRPLRRLAGSQEFYLDAGSVAGHLHLEVRATVLPQLQPRVLTVVEDARITPVVAVSFGAAAEVSHRVQILP